MGHRSWTGWHHIAATVQQRTTASRYHGRNSFFVDPVSFSIRSWGLYGSYNIKPYLVLREFLFNCTSGSTLVICISLAALLSFVLLSLMGFCTFPFLTSPDLCLPSSFSRVPSSKRSGSHRQCSTRTSPGVTPTCCQLMLCSRHSLNSVKSKLFEVLFLFCLQGLTY